MQNSTDLMRSMIHLVQVPEITQVARQLSKEMTKVMSVLPKYEKFFLKLKVKPAIEKLIQYCSKVNI